MKNILFDLLKIKSVSSNIEELNKIVNYVENYFNGTNAIIDKFVFNNKPSIVIKNFDGTYADIVLNGHLDVVPISEENQFKPYEKDGKLFARGAGDMKAGVAVMMQLMKDLLLNNFSKKKISLILTTDEEIGGFDGAKKLLEKGYNGKVVLIPDSGSKERIVYSEKGVLLLDLEFKGKSSHASRAWLGENAIENGFNFYNLLRYYIQNTNKLLGTKDHWGSSVNLNVVNGGTATNIIPDKANFKIDIRFTEEFKLDELLDFIQKNIVRFNGSVNNVVPGNVLYTDPENKYIQNYFKIAKKYVPNAILDKEHGASDGRFFSEKGAIVLLQRPDCGNLHGKKEYVVLDDLEVIYNIYKDFINS